MELKDAIKSLEKDKYVNVALGQEWEVIKAALAEKPQFEVSVVVAALETIIHSANTLLTLLRGGAKKSPRKSQGPEDAPNPRAAAGQSVPQGAPLARAKGSRNRS